MPRTPGMVVTLKPTNNTYGGNLKPTKTSYKASNIWLGGNLKPT